MSRARVTELPGIVSIENLLKLFPAETGLLGTLLAQKRFVQAVSDITLAIDEGETVGLVGESGSGKTTLGKCVLRLIEPTSGRIIYRGTDLCSLSRESMRKTRRELQMVFQDPYSSLNPRRKIGDILVRPLEIHGIAKGAEARRKADETTQLVGLPEDCLDRYPHEFSGGQRQRIALARALVVEPRFVVADEPVSALDVSIQSQILNLFKDMQTKYRFSSLFISHDLAVVEYISDRVAVMYLGKLIELAPTEALYDNAVHPYTKALLSSVPSFEETDLERIVLKGDLPSPIDPPPGCRFSTRCPYAQPMCSSKEPELVEITPRHYVACSVFAPR
jgi:oligopeptide/dipeptide ABC transporter ATP-binding protein